MTLTHINPEFITLSCPHNSNCAPTVTTMVDTVANVVDTVTTVGDTVAFMILM